MSDRKSLESKPHVLSNHKKKFDDLCEWIDEHLGEPIGWQELMAHSSGLDYQTINALFFRYASTTPMTWIRRRRDARVSAAMQIDSPPRPSGPKPN